MTTQEKVQLLNSYYESVNYVDDNIYEFDEHTVNGVFKTPFDALRSAYFGKVDFTHNYFKFDGYGNIQTLADWEIDDLYKEIEEVEKD